MNELMRRRRALMTAGEREDPSLIYEVKNQVETSFRVWSVPIYPLKLDVATTILFHLNITELTSQSKIFSIWDASNNRQASALGRIAGSNYWVCVANASSYTPISQTDDAKYNTGEWKFLYTHDANSNQYNFYVKKINGGSVRSATKISSYVAINGPLSFGTGSSGGGSSFPKGTIYLMQVFNRVLSADEIDAFFA